MRASAQAIAYLGTVLFGGLHALASLYWGLGGRWLLETIGQGAIELRDEGQWWVFLMLLLVASVKVAGVLVPIANARGLLPRPRLWRVLSWLGAVGLIVYGGTNTLLAHLALTGRFGEVDDRQAMVGHAYLWDPLFLAWGLSLAAALILDRRNPATTHSR